MLVLVTSEMQVLLKDIVPAAQNNINTAFIILEKGKPSPGPNGKTCLVLAADQTAAVHTQLWGNECEAFEPGDIVRLTSGIFSYVRNHGLVLRAGKRGKMEKTGEFAMVFVETPNMSEIHWKLDPTNPKRYIQEMVASPYSQIFPPMR
ncbi:PREDICTED: SOSS complex subunit B homolog isoform X2 [Tarenaya hassleriana]|uniref:SOSS complex subunit B homolog isoform X2 n=1 Tax=Tarenaya hassleriana TaxID=28532 RepID=UPI00053C47EB|nr:PREDICTED: SOSS complex subunit B homolog isoform X2 [Tarenaya hassleriana]XP_010557258.1 PREDICTED: SOSS complex subunit B homolog isoform X2 [Tarenaya hassleriana]XP_010557259.1 PREDICTED: SOSS complex subunit B homolog isoform X2 [Tarenaya hassleriana]XP_010557260.1 PREDICTED: SOSS complex subunit B homolog isoform X2 [Tarenaya hassleriana]XP_010557261.1 PREDICTED: SOSS complex subunit B homolog isoform X2 [Tarenaya hassleriana]